MPFVLISLRLLNFRDMPSAPAARLMPFRVYAYDAAHAHAMRRLRYFATPACHARLLDNAVADASATCRLIYYACRFAMMLPLRLSQMPLDMSYAIRFICIRFILAVMLDGCRRLLS